MTAAISPRTPLRDLAGLAGWLALCFGVAGFGGWVTAGSVNEWYPALAKPSWNPPKAAFGPVWTVLFALMAMAAWLVWRRPCPLPGRRAALAAFVVQLVLNGGWSWCFFGWRSPLAGLIEIAFLWVAIGTTLVLFIRVSRPAAGLLVPYWLWVSFAAALNAAIWQLNRGG